MPPLRSRKHQGILALLTLRHGREVQRDWVAGTLWPDSAEPAAFHSLRQGLVDVRRALGGQASRLGSPTTRSLCLDLSGADVDVLDFDAAVRKGDPDSLERVVSVYRGPLLEGNLEEWVFGERSSREQAYLRAREMLAEHALTAGDSEAAIDHLRKVIAVEKLRESAYCRLMQALADHGDYAGVVQVYRDLRLLLQGIQGAEPSSETTALFHQLRHPARPTQQTKSGASNQLAAPSPAFIPRDTNNLPPALTSFIGRRSELAEITSLLSRCRLLTLTGSGGCGKTRLALEIAAAQLEDFADGVWLVELASLSDPGLVGQIVQKAFEIPEQAGCTATETLSSYLRSRHLLLVLDNCEHLLKACSRLVETLLRSCSHLTILATSREELQVEGEQPWRVPPMDHPLLDQADVDPKELSELLLEFDACLLFVERARVHRPDFRLTEHNALSMVELCRHLDGIPLALELAATRLRSLTLEEINSRLDQRFQLLKRSTTTAPHGVMTFLRRRSRHCFEGSPCLRAAGPLRRRNSSAPGKVFRCSGIQVFRNRRLRHRDSRTPEHPNT